MCIIISFLFRSRLPDWARKAIEPNGTMAYIAAMNYKLQTDTKPLARLFSGFLIKEMLDRNAFIYILVYDGICAKRFEIF